MYTGHSSIAVFGAGHGGMALAGYLGRRGHHVALWNRSAGRVAPVAARGGVRLVGPGSVPAFGRVALATTSMAAALRSARVVLVAVPASGHADVARACAPHLCHGQTVLLLPGRTGGALEFRQVLHEAGCRARILLGEANTFPFAARSVGPAEAILFGSKAEVRVAALPATGTPELLRACRPALPMLTAAGSVLETGLSNLGAILHPTITLLNAERIEARQSFDFYTEGVTPAVADVLAAADEERLRIANAYGVAAYSLQDWVATAYGHRSVSLRGAVAENPAYVGIKAPDTVEHRYLLEDVPTGLIPLLELGEAAGLNFPTLTHLVDRTRALLGGEPWRRQRTLVVLGLRGLDTWGIRAVVEDGVAPVAAGRRPGRRPRMPALVSQLAFGG